MRDPLILQSQESIKGVKRFFATARERYNIKLRRERGDPQPWTGDPVFQQWRFCNVHREDDRTTAWFRDNVRSKLSGLSVVQATICFRWFNRIETGQIILPELLGNWDTDLVREKLAHVEPVVTGAYMVYTPPGMSKLDGLLTFIDHALPQLPEMVARWGRSLQATHRDLLQLYGLGRFAAYEVVTDLRWTNVLDHAEDIDTWASAGPGCARGLTRVLGMEPSGPDAFHYGSQKDQAVMADIMRKLLDASRSEPLWPQAWPKWEMREVEHWACEFDKYQRGAQGDRLKRRFP